MNKQYMDFVPAKSKVHVPAPAISGAKTHTAPSRPVAPSHPAPSPARPASSRPAHSSAAQTTARPTAEVSVESLFVERARPAGVSSGLPEPKYGVIEDFQPKFVNTKVEKRPLALPHLQPDPKPVIVSSPDRKKAPKPSKAKAPKSPSKEDAILEHALKNAGGGDPANTAKSAPARTSTPFVNTEKVAKRPLSKNVYAKKIESPKEDHEPVTIITKPEKDSRAGTIVAIIITIILGATAGTVAFLLLPK